MSRVLQNQQETCVLIAKSSALSRSTWLRRASASSADGPAAVRRRVRACQERETVAGSALTGSNLADVGENVQFQRMTRFYPGLDLVRFAAASNCHAVPSCLLRLARCIFRFRNGIKRSRIDLSHLDG